MGDLNPLNFLGMAPTADPTPITLGPEKELFERNNPVLFEIYLFYSYHAKSVKNARADGHATPVGSVDSEDRRAMACGPERWDRPLLGPTDFLQLLKDFKLATGPVTGPWLASQLTAEEGKLTYRRFATLLLTIAEAHHPRFPKDKAFFSLLEMMDYSEQLYIIIETGQLGDKDAQFDLNEPTWRSVVDGK